MEGPWIRRILALIAAELAACFGVLLWIAGPGAPLTERKALEHRAAVERLASAALDEIGQEVARLRIAAADHAAESDLSELAADVARLEASLAASREACDAKLYDLRAGVITTHGNQIDRLWHAVTGRPTEETGP